MFRERRAVVFPLWPLNLMKKLLFVVFFLLALVIVALPSTADSSEFGGLMSYAMKVPVIESMAKQENMVHPAAYSIGYLIALALGAVFGIATCFTKGDVSPLENLVKKKSYPVRAIWLAGAILLICSFTLLPGKPSGTSLIFWESIASNRLMILILVESVFLLTAVLMLYVIFEISNFLYWDRHR